MTADLDRDMHITLAHGEGGRATARLVRELFLAHLGNPQLDLLDDGAQLELSRRVAISTDAFVVDPIFFPGGDIGKLAVCGTVNDVAMCGAVPRALAVAFVIEEGWALGDLERVVSSMAAEASAAGVSVVTGDTKVVPRGRADGLYVTTTGVGEVIEGVAVGSRLVCAGDHVLVSGPLGDHGTAIMAVRAGLAMGDSLSSDCACTAAAVVELLREVPTVHCLRDPTRGGLAAVLCEIAASSGVGIQVHEAKLPVSATTRAACEILGLEPTSMACEGRFVAFVPAAHAPKALDLLRARADCPQACEIGRVTDAHPGKVVIQTPIGGQRLLDVPEGEPLPRIC